MNFCLRIVAFVAFGEAQIGLDQRDFCFHAERLIKTLRGPIMPERFLIAVLGPGKPTGAQLGLGANGRRNGIVGSGKKFLELLVAFGEVAADFPVSG